MTTHAVLRAAATLVLVRDGAQGMEVFMMQRTHKAVFVPGGYQGYRIKTHDFSMT
jgi:8-oxo-dGTP pyrophosphatase MutT (NUDIX family)